MPLFGGTAANVATYFYIYHFFNETVHIAYYILIGDRTLFLMQLVKNNLIKKMEKMHQIKIFIKYSYNVFFSILIGKICKQI